MSPQLFGSPTSSGVPRTIERHQRAHHHWVQLELRHGGGQGRTVGLLAPRSVHGSFRLHPRCSGGWPFHEAYLSGRWPRHRGPSFSVTRGCAASSGIGAEPRRAGGEVHLPIHGVERGLARAHRHRTSAACRPRADGLGGRAEQRPLGVLVLAGSAGPTISRRACRWSPVAPVSRWIVGMGRIT